MIKPLIVIDARLYGPKHTGLGRYTKNLLVALACLSDFNKYKFTLLIYPELESEINKDLGSKYKYYVTNIRHYSLLEQLLLPLVLYTLHPSLVHFSHLDKPILYFGKSVVTVHDLIRHFSHGPDTTTHTPWLYWPKYFGYLLMTRIILATSYLIVPSNFWRDYIVEKYKYDPHKIITTYEAVDPKLRIQSPKLIKNFKLKIKNYVLYTGNLYPHKNIIVVFQALQQLPTLKLKIICARDVFQQQALELAQKLHLESQVSFLGYVKDSDFQPLYSSALALVHPAILEGFSLTGLEAMTLGCPVIAANSSCLPEIYQQSVLYFDPHNPQQLVDQITKLQQQPKTRQKLVTLGYSQVAKYSWSQTATQTLQFYGQIIKNS